MVYVPILKIDLPEPRLQELIPGLVTVVLGACTLAFDAVYDFLHPLSPQGEQQIYEATIMSLPREFRKARRRVFELDIKDDDKIDEELETAAFNYYRRRMREEVAGYSDEGPEDVSLRRLMSPDSAARDLTGLLPLEAAILAQDTEALQQLTAGPSSQAAAAAGAVLPPPSRARRATTTAAVGGAGLALGAGVVKLVAFLHAKLAKQRRKAKRRAAAVAGQTGSRHGSEQGGAAAAAAAGGARGSRRGSTGTGRSTPRQR